MRDLLVDDVAVRQHFEEVHGLLGLYAIPVSKRPRVHEGGDITAYLGNDLSDLFSSWDN